MRRFIKSHWHILLAVTLLILYFVSQIEFLKYTYRGLIAYGLLKAAIRATKSPLKLKRGFSVILFMFSFVIIILSLVEIVGLRSVAVPEITWIIARGIIDPTYYMLLPWLERRARSKKQS
jgi:hypothetical protein